MATKARSPNYPAFGLGKAIDLVRKVHGSINHHKAPALVVVKAIGYSSMNGKSLSAISALKKYGLLEDVGKEFKVSKDALLILFEPIDSATRTSAIERAAFSPDLFAKLRIEFPGALPSDELVRSYLLQNGFLLTTVDQAIRAYRDTMELVSGISEGYNGTDEKSIANGDETGIPMEELALERSSGAPLTVMQPKAFPKSEVSATAGEREWLRGDLSKAKGIGYRLIVSGDVGPKEIGKLIKLLEAQKLVLDDEDEVSES
jgi:hypothetical protein